MQHNLLKRDTKSDATFILLHEIGREGGLNQNEKMVSAIRGTDDILVLLMSVSHLLLYQLYRGSPERLMLFDDAAKQFKS